MSSISSSISTNNVTTAVDTELFFGLPLTTHRDHGLGTTVDTYFQYEALIAAISILFFRSSVYYGGGGAGKKKKTTKKDNALVIIRWCFALLLAFLAYKRKSYELIISIEIFSYAVPIFLRPVHQLPFKKFFPSEFPSIVIRILGILISGFMSISLCHSAASGSLLRFLSFITPKYIIDVLNILFPIQEVTAAYQIMTKFQNPIVLRKQINHLLFVTFHIQVS